MNPFLSLVTSLVAAIVLVAAICVAIIVVHKFTGSQSVVALVGFAGALIVASIQYRAAKDKETEARLFSEKQGIYTELVDVILNMFRPEQFRKEPINTDDLARKLLDIRNKLIVWGSFDTIRSLDQMGEIDPSNPLGSGSRRLAAVFSAIRKDLGHRDPENAGLEMALVLLRHEDRADARKVIEKAIGNA